ncbi:GNAT family N-acetyltransferase [Rossellomorea aquimaris]|uniref:GNAT family N-acetyltransferase n=1 Tax=Rossellomorea aquimaris TaxID=189382 RepID=A0A5D4U6C7_9BACI|nr:GNAT family N-acetyltransferase [Rossellomorea aquimaris]TYS82944.1 GNAT family N-acetyltransferase [Rossellomorea aquimaris]
MNYSIRKMNAGDIPAVQKVAEISWNDTYKDIIPLEIQQRFLSSAYNDEMMLKRLEASCLYIAETDGLIAGFANFSKVKEEGEVELGAIYLLPEHQGKGAGTLLLNKGADAVKDIKKIFINVEKENHKGINFYHAKGFKAVSEFQDDLFGHMTDMKRMVLIIRSVQPL